MRLYHGTSAAVGVVARARGLSPRRDVGRQNWAHTSPSHPRAVYLTDAYPLYFAVQAANNCRSPQTHVAVVEVEADRLPKLVPDEDVLEQVGRGQDDLPAGWTMRQRTVWYRNRLDDHAGRGTWEKSLEAMGTCAHLGAVPPEAITRVALVNLSEGAALLFEGMQPAICLANYKWCGEDYRKLTASIWDPYQPGVTILENRK